MNTKLLTSAGCLLLLTAAIAPSALGHNERPSNSINGYPGAPGGGVSGTYVGAAGPALAIDAYTQNSPEYNVFALGSMVCDWEVASDDPTDPANEENVDGNNGHAGVVLDNFDDGGEGGACHSTSYTTGVFNTANCYSGQPAHGSNGVTDVWLGASCDWKTDQGGTSSFQTLELCAVNAVLAFNPLQPPVPTGALGEAEVIVDCAGVFVACLGNPACGATGATESCGADHTADAIDFGYGSGSFNPAIFPANTGVYFGTPDGAPCGDGAAAIFVFDAIATNGGTTVGGEYVPDATSVQVYPALTGDVWTGGPAGTFVGGGPVPVCAEEYDNGVYTTWPCPPYLCGLPLGYVAIASDGGAEGTLSCHNSSHTTVGTLTTTLFTVGPIVSGDHAHCDVSAVNGATYAFVQCGKV